MADRTIKRGSTSVILHIPVVWIGGAQGSSGGNVEGTGEIQVTALGDAAGVGYSGTDGNIEAIAVVGTYAAPSAGKCRAGFVPATGTGISDTSVLEVHLANALFAKTGRQLTIVYRETSGPSITTYTVDLSDLDVENGEADLRKVLGTAPTEGAGGRLAAAFTKFFDKASPTGTINSIPDAVGGAAGGLLIAGTNAATLFTGGLTINSAVKKNTANADGFPFVMRDSAFHLPIVGMTVTATRSINGGAFAAGTLGAITEISAGVYKMAGWGAGDVNGSHIMLKFSAAGCDDSLMLLVTQP